MNAINSSPAALALANIERDMLLQPRATLHRDWIEDYAADMVAGAVFPPIIVFFDGEKYWLADGFHRLYAAEAAGLSHISADVRQGDRRDALLLSVGVNGEHGHRRTNDDKRRSVDIMLLDPEWSQWSDRQIAERCAVHHDTVSNRRRDLSVGNRQVRKVTRGGTTYEMETGAIGAEPPSSDGPTGTDPGKEEEEPSVQFEFDWAASAIRNAAMEAIRALGAQPEPQIVIDAWMKTRSYGEPIETLEKAHAWLGHFLALY